MAFRAYHESKATALLVLLLFVHFITLPADAKSHSFAPPPNTPSRRHDDHPAKIGRPPPNTNFPVPPQWRYHVFLNFRGLDVRHSFSSHLYHALLRMKIKAFRDDRDLPRGEKIREAIPRAIDESMMSIAVLSEGYASSEWCLDELVKMTDTAQVFPVFYKVSPDDVSDQSSGCYKDDFDSHKRKFSYERVDNWRRALTSVAEVTGWVIGPNDHRSEAEMIETIAKDIVSTVNQMMTRTTVPLTEGESSQNNVFRQPEGTLNDREITTAAATEEDHVAPSSSSSSQEEASEDYKGRLWTSTSCTCNNDDDSSSSSNSNNKNNIMLDHDGPKLEL